MKLHTEIRSKNFYLVDEKNEVVAFCSNGLTEINARVKEAMSFLTLESELLRARVINDYRPSRIGKYRFGLFAKRSNRGLIESAQSFATKEQALEAGNKVVEACQSLD